MKLAKAEYRLSNDLARKEAYGLISQLQRAAVSVPCNIAEGHGGLTDLQFRHFLGTLCDLQTQVELAYDLGYIGSDQLKVFMEQSPEVARLINGLITSLRELHSTANKTRTPLTARSAANAASSAVKDFRS